MRAKMICAAALVSAACAGTPDNLQEASELEMRARASLDTMKRKDPAIARMVGQAHGYVVFPGVGKGGFIAGGAHGTGVVYERGRAVGYAELNQASIGAQLGGQTFAELVVLKDPATFDRLKRDRFEMGVDASVVAITVGGGKAARFQQGVAVFVMPSGGLMVDMSIHGQQITFEPRG